MNKGRKEAFLRSFLFVYKSIFDFRSEFCRSKNKAQNIWQVTARNLHHSDYIPFSILDMCQLTCPLAYFTLKRHCVSGAGIFLWVQHGHWTHVYTLLVLQNCRVVGCAGTDDKCAWLKSIGFDHVFNYKTADLATELKAAAPNGFNVFFDNVSKLEMVLQNSVCMC